MNKEISFGKAIRFVFYSFMQTILHWSLPPVRVLLLRFLGARVGRECVILDCVFSNAYHYGFSRLTVGNRCFIGGEALLDLRGWITMEDYVTLSHRVSLVTHINVGFKDYPLQKRYPTKESPVMLKRGCYVGTGAIILPGVTIGKESVVGAGAVVTKDVPDKKLAVGVPAHTVVKQGH